MPEQLRNRERQSDFRRRSKRLGPHSSHEHPLALMSRFCACVHPLSPELGEAQVLLRLRNPHGWGLRLEASGDSLKLQASQARRDGRQGPRPSRLWALRPHPVRMHGLGRHRVSIRQPPAPPPYSLLLPRAQAAQVSASATPPCTVAARAAHTTPHHSTCPHHSLPPACPTLPRTPRLGDRLRLGTPDVECRRAASASWAPTESKSGKCSSNQRCRPHEPRPLPSRGAGV